MSQDEKNNLSEFFVPGEKGAGGSMAYIPPLIYAANNLYQFGRGVGDSGGPRGDDEASRRLSISTPIIFYRGAEISFHVSFPI